MKYNASFSLAAFLMLLQLSEVLSVPIKAVEDYPRYPNEVLPIQPVQLYPHVFLWKDRRSSGRELSKDENDIIYVKLLKDDAYHPPKYWKEKQSLAAGELNDKDIFYVKVAANGQFSDRRLKLYHLPEFYAILFFRRGDGVQK